MATRFPLPWPLFYHTFVPSQIVVSGGLRRPWRPRRKRFSWLVPRSLNGQAPGITIRLTRNARGPILVIPILRASSARRGLYMYPRSGDSIIEIRELKWNACGVFNRVRFGSTPLWTGVRLWYSQETTILARCDPPCYALFPEWDLGADSYNGSRLPVPLLLAHDQEYYLKYRRCSVRNIR